VTEGAESLYKAAYYAVKIGDKGIILDGRPETILKINQTIGLNLTTAGAAMDCLGSA